MVQFLLLFVSQVFIKVSYLLERMQQKILSFDSPKKVLSPQNSPQNTTTITSMRCRCAHTRRVNNVLVEWERRNRKRMLRNREYKRLRDCVPTIARKNVDKLTIILEAVDLIRRLETAVIKKLQTKGVPKSCLSIV